MSERAAADLRDQKPPKPKEAPPVSEPAKDASPPPESQVKPAPAQPAAVAPSASRFHLRPVPIFMVILLGFGIPLLAGLLIDFAGDHMRLPSVHGSKLAYLYFHHGVQLILALIAIA